MGKIYDELLAKVLKRKNKVFDENEYPKLFKKHRKKIEVLLKKKIEMEKKKKEQEENTKKTKEFKVLKEQIRRIEDRLNELNNQLTFLKTKGILELMKIERENIIKTEIKTLQDRLEKLRKNI